MNLDQYMDSLSFSDGGPIKPPKKIEPIIVNDKNDKRLRAYNDSLSLYNIGEDIEKLHSKNKLTLDDARAMDRTRDKYRKSLRELNGTTPQPTGKKPLHIYKPSVISLILPAGQVLTYDKPVQPVVYQPKEQQAQSAPKPKTYTNAEELKTIMKNHDPKKVLQVAYKSQLEQIQPKQPNIEQNDIMPDQIPLQPEVYSPKAAAVNTYTSAGYPMVGGKTVPTGRVHDKGWQEYATGGKVSLDDFMDSIR